VIRIRGARTHNLKNINLDLKINKITCISGPSGSGKSSLAFHTLLTESKRRYLNSFPNDFKYFFDIPNTVDVDEIHPVLPVWGLSQVNPIVGSRPVVADHLGVHQGLEKLFFIAGFPVCPVHQVSLQREELGEKIINYLREKLKAGTSVAHLLARKEKYKEIFGSSSFPARSLNEQGMELRNYDVNDQLWEIGRYRHVSLDKLIKQLEGEFRKFEFHELKIFMDGALENIDQVDGWYCPECDFGTTRLALTSFELSPYNPVGACDKCQGHGMKLEYDRDKLVRESHLSLKEEAVYLVKYSRFAHYLPALLKLCRKKGLDINLAFDQLPEKKWKILFEGGEGFPGLSSLLEYLESKKYKKNVRIYLRGLQKEVICDQCHGSRLSQLAYCYGVSVGSKRLMFKDILLNNLEFLINFLLKLQKEFSEKRQNSEVQISVQKIISRMLATLQVTSCLNLNQLFLNTKVKTLLVGEYQRILLAKILSYEGAGSLFILDEPCTGLSEAEQKRLFVELNKIKDQGNTVLIVEHSNLAQSLSDELVLMGPGAGHRGGEILYQGRPKKSKSSKSHKKLLNNTQSWLIKIKSRKKELSILENIEFKANRINVIKGASSSSYKHDAVTKRLFLLFKEMLEGRKNNFQDCTIQGLDYLKDCHFFDGGMGRMTSRSTIGTTTGLSQVVRKEFCRLPVSKALNLEEGHFSSYSSVGQCPSCEGKGVRTVDMQFLEDIQFTCDDCRGMKIKPFYGTISNGHWTFHEIMKEPMDRVLSSVRLTPKYQRVFESIKKLNLQYLELDRSLTSLSGGERIRVKLLSKLETIQSENLYIFDNLSLGLSQDDLIEVFKLISSMALMKNTFILIDESPYLARMADNLLNL
jgi:excinuclease ABC subunit A